MANIALGKPVEEPITNPTAATDGKITDYSAVEGFAEFSWPYVLTVDLGIPHALYCIRVLLWDGLGKGNKQRDNRIYRYRLLTSVDHLAWKVVYDSSNEGGNGWQVFNFPDTLEVRYIRVHGIWNSANTAFQVVQVEAYDDSPPDLDAEIVLQRTVLSESVEYEIGDGMPLQARVGGIINRIERLVEDNELLNPAPFRQLILQLRNQVSDVAALERGMDSIRREIITPVHRELQQGKRIGRFSVWGFWVGLIGGLLAIVSLVLPLVQGLRLKPTPPKEPSAEARIDNVPVSFLFNAAEGSHRVWREDIWYEGFPDGKKVEFRPSGRIILNDCTGTSLYKSEMKDLEIFVPDKGCLTMNVNVRANRGPWHFLGAMNSIK